MNTDSHTTRIRPHLIPENFREEVAKIRMSEKKYEKVISHFINRIKN